jgi:cytidylate kinase
MNNPRLVVEVIPYLILIITKGSNMNRGSANAFTSFLRAQSTPAGSHVRQKPALTISRQAGAGALTVAKLVADQLDIECPGDPPCPWAVFDRNLVEEIVRDNKLSQRVADYMVEDAKFPLSDAFEAMLGLHPSSWRMMEQAADTIRKLALKGNVILVGRGSAAITAKLPHVLHVRLVAPFEQRVRHFELYYHIDEKEAPRLVRERDEARRRYVRQFGADIDDPVNYTLVINTGEVSFEEAARIITNTILDTRGARRAENITDTPRVWGTRARLD